MDSGGSGFVIVFTTFSFWNAFWGTFWRGFGAWEGGRPVVLRD